MIQNFLEIDERIKTFDDPAVCPYVPDYIPG
jgi:hypothetical protein